MSTVRTAKKLLLGREIAHMIDVAGLSQTDAAGILETSKARITSLINGGGSISPGDLVLLASKLGFTDEGYQEALRELRRDNHKRGFWSIGHNRAYSEDLRLLIDLEKHADQIRQAEVEIVPGLLQTEAYIRAMHAGSPDTDGVTAEDYVQARLARQAILDKAEPPAMHFVLSESCLRRMRSDADVMAEQVERLIELSNRRNVMIQVMPFRVEPARRVAIGSRFVLLHVPSPGAAGALELAYIEGEGEFRYLDDRMALAAYESAWARLANSALRFDESRKFMAQIARDWTDESSDA